MSNRNSFNRSVFLDNAIQDLNDAFDRIEGMYSNIPLCCIREFISGQTYSGLMETLNKKDQKKLSKWHYVPCEKCFKKNRINKLKMNGTSEVGQIVNSFIAILQNRRKSNDKRSTR